MKFTLVIYLFTYRLNSLLFSYIMNTDAINKQSNAIIIIIIIMMIMIIIIKPRVFCFRFFGVTI
jgi:hypothetical protein